MSCIKPNWKDAPPWARWLAQDGDGNWYWYEDRPIASTSGSRVWIRSTTRTNQMQAPDIDDAWSKTLERKP